MSSEISRLLDEVADLKEQLEATQLRLKTCSTNCTTHELNEAKALAQLEAVRPYLSHKTNCNYFKGVPDPCNCGLQAAIGENKSG